MFEIIARASLLARVDAGHDLGSANQTLASYLNTWIKQAGSVKDLKPGTIHQHHVNIDSYIAHAASISTCDSLMGG